MKQTRLQRKTPMPRGTGLRPGGWLKRVALKRIGARAKAEESERRAACEAVRLRDRVCQDCGATRFQAILDVDHIKLRSLCTKEERWALDNLQLRCRRCHDRKHGHG